MPKKKKVYSKKELESYTGREVQILESLARFKYVTHKQFAKIMGIKSTSNISYLTGKLRSRTPPLTERKPFGVMPVHGQLEHIHYLTAEGKDFLINQRDYEEKNIKYSKKILFSHEYFHRLYIINFNIYFQKWLANNDYSLRFFNYDFEKVGGNRNKDPDKKLKSLNALEMKDFYIIPDGIGFFSTDERPYLFLFEQHNGTTHNRRAIEQIKKHIIALSEGTASERFKIKSGARVVYVFEKEVSKKAVMKELSNDKDFMSFEKYFLFKSNTELERGFFAGWKLAGGQVVNFI